MTLIFSCHVLNNKMVYVTLPVDYWFNLWTKNKRTYIFGLCFLYLSTGLFFYLGFPDKGLVGFQHLAKSFSSYRETEY